MWLFQVAGDDDDSYDEVKVDGDDDGDGDCAEA